MSKRYQVLARKYRPQAFKDVVGQTAVVTTLKNAIRFDKVAHAYLFCGSRGVGKTTLARLFAKTLNCAKLTEDLEPCNQCPSCIEITSGVSLDVIEIDGASNRGIDDIRQINETVCYAPTHGKYKIYIIDEVHMLTKEAFNALLKTLEEPPEMAKFFFATTEAHKVLATIISRCQRFDLSRILPEKIASKLDEIAKDIQRDVDRDALELIAHFSEGSLRDAESLFDQILVFTDEKITQQTVRDALGLVPKELFQNLDEAFHEFRLEYAFELVDELFQKGKDLSHFLEQLIEHYRNIVNAKCKSNINHPTAHLYSQQQSLHILDLLIQSEPTFQKSTFQRISLESILLQIIRSKNRIPAEVLVRRLLENIDPKKEPPLKQEPVEKETAPIAAEILPPNLAKVLPKEPKIEAPTNPEPIVEIVENTKNDNIPFQKPEPKKIDPPPVHLTLDNPSQSRYDTVMRFAAVELEGTLKT